MISDIERDDLHREILRTQGKLTSCFGYDGMGRKAWQFTSTLPADSLSTVQHPDLVPGKYVQLLGYDPSGGEFGVQAD